MTTTRHHYFPVQSLRVTTDLQPNGEYTAIDADNYDGPGSPMGFGLSQMEAIVELREQMVERGLLEKDEESN